MRQFLDRRKCEAIGFLCLCRRVSNVGEGQKARPPHHHRGFHMTERAGQPTGALSIERHLGHAIRPNFAYLGIQTNR